MEKTDILQKAHSSTGISSRLSVFWAVPELRLLIAILIGVTLLSYQSDAFLTARNMRSVLLGFSFVGIAALGQLFVIVTARIDLSSGSVRWAFRYGHRSGNGCWSQYVVGHAGRCWDRCRLRLV